MGRVIRTAAGLVKFAAIALVIGLVIGWGSSPWQTPSGPTALDGTIVIKAVDDQRVLVAVDASNEGKKEDGKFEHLFLYTSESAVKVAPQTLVGAHLEHDHGALVVIRGGVTVLQIVGPNATATRPATVTLNPGSLSHYWGPFGTTLDDVTQATRSDACAHACFRLGSREIEFPL